MLTGIVTGFGIMLAYIAIGFAAERYISKLGQRLAQEGATDAGKILDRPDLG